MELPRTSSSTRSTQERSPCQSRTPPAIMDKTPPSPYRYCDVQHWYHDFCNMGGERLTLQVEQTIRTLSKEGNSYSVIVKKLKAEGLDVGKATICRVVNGIGKKREAESNGQKFQVDRPRPVRTPATVSKVKRLATTENPPSQRQLSRMCGTSLKTINNIIHKDLELDTRRKGKVHKLTPFHMKNRATNARKLYEEHLAGSRSEYTATLDEAWMYVTYCNGIRKICYIKRGNQVPDNWVHQCSETFPKGFMVVGVMTGRGVLPLIKVPSKVKVNSEFYIECVLKPVIEQLKDLYPGEMDKVFLHHDKASSHTSNKTQQFLQEMKDTLGLNFIRNSDIPVKSPDASPLDFYGFALNDELLIVRYFKFCTEAGRMRKNAEQRILEDDLYVNRSRPEVLLYVAGGRSSTNGALPSKMEKRYVMGMVQKQGNWVPYELKPGIIERRICTCELLLKRQNRKGFLHRIVTGDEKWIHYDNPKRRKSSVKPGHASTSTAKPNIHGKKLMLCIWWDQLGVIYYELLQPNETITGERYQQQLMRLSRALKIKRPLYAKRHDKVIYQHDNARPHVAKVVKETLEALQWDVLPHPLYSPDIAPSDYHIPLGNPQDYNRKAETMEPNGDCLNDLRNKQQQQTSWNRPLGNPQDYNRKAETMEPNGDCLNDLRNKQQQQQQTSWNRPLGKPQDYNRKAETMEPNGDCLNHLRNKQQQQQQTSWNRPLGKPQDYNRKAETMEPNGDRLNDLRNEQQQQTSWNRPLGKPQDYNRKAETMEPNGDRLNDLRNEQQQQTSWNRPLGKPQDYNRKAETMEPNRDRLNDLRNKQQQQGGCDVEDTKRTQGGCDVEDTKRTRGGCDVEETKRTQGGCDVEDTKRTQGGCDVEDTKRTQGGCDVEDTKRTQGGCDVEDTKRTQGGCDVEDTKRTQGGCDVEDTKRTQGGCHVEDTKRTQGGCDVEDTKRTQGGCDVEDTKRTQGGCDVEDTKRTQGGCDVEDTKRTQGGCDVEDTNRTQGGCDVEDTKRTQGGCDVEDTKRTQGGCDVEDTKRTQGGCDVEDTKRTQGGCDVEDTKRTQGGCDVEDTKRTQGGCDVEDTKR
ncbi:hypothetical protein LAZ67_11003714 [Cordylochernes scorpioides]|uniref:Transposase n=1 Tax=Cordylochernes scorpioides TaxID=51811 RepID=A0ABY6L041_9ARAC|nr:hypothetical protein LAZ67_11003714 [Cordylochernes scorpioides]